MQAISFLWCKSSDAKTRLIDATCRPASSSNLWHLRPRARSERANDVRSDPLETHSRRDLQLLHIRVICDQEQQDGLKMMSYGGAVRSSSLPETSAKSPKRTTLCLQKASANNQEAQMFVTHYYVGFDTLCRLCSCKLTTWFLSELRCLGKLRLGQSS